MSLNGKQKKYLKKHLRNSALSTIAIDLGVSPIELKDYLKKKWGNAKYYKFLSQPLNAPLKETSPKIFSTNFKSCLTHHRRALIFLTLLVVAVYANSLKGTFVSDDVGAIAQNTQLGTARYIFSDPLRLVHRVTYFTINQLFGPNPAAYRAVNILFHLGTVLVSYFLVRVLTNSTTALLTATLVTAHPIMTEAVTWISGGAHVRYSFFSLLSFLAYLLGTDKKKYYVLSLISLLLALLSAEKAAVLPIIFLIYEIANRSISENWKKLIVPFLLGGSRAIASAAGLNQRVQTLQTSLHQVPQTINPLVQIPIAISSYLELIFWPNKLTLYHSEMTFSTTEFVIRLLITITFLGCIVYAYRRQRQVFFWLSFFIVSLLPTLTPFGVSWIVAERYVYFGTIGIFAVIALGFKKLLEIDRARPLTIALFSLMILTLSIRTVVRNADWKNQDTLWLAAARTSPSSSQNHNNLGDLYARRGDLEKAISEFERAIELNPEYANAYHNLANTHQQNGEITEAVENYQKAIEFDPNLWQSHQNLASIYFEQGQLDIAEEKMKQAIAINPQNADLYLNLRVIYLQMDDGSRAEELLQKAQELDPQIPIPPIESARP